MKKLAVVSFSLFLFSCENTWDSEARDLFHAGCMEAAKEAYMEEYPSFSDAMENADKLMEDEDLKACK